MSMAFFRYPLQRLSVVPLLLLTALESLSVAAVPGAHFLSESQKPGQISPSDKEGAISALSGSPWPGVIDHLLQKPLDDKDASINAVIHINFPSIGNPRIDADIREWVESLAETFDKFLEPGLQAELPEMDFEQGKFLHDDDLASHLALRQPEPYELWGNYQVSRPSDHAVSITFEIWNYTGNQKGNLDVLVLNYNLHTGQRLGLADIFEKPDIALDLMSAWSRKKLDARLGAARRARMLEEGTAPLVENFSSLTLTPEGVRINFQPYQVALWDAGIQKVDMPLSELLSAGPLISLWGKTPFNLVQ